VEDSHLHECHPLKKLPHFSHPFIGLRNENKMDAITQWLWTYGVYVAA
jgi:hypothetical protein